MLRRESQGGTRSVKQIVFEGERLDVMAVRRWREKALGTPAHIYYKWEGVSPAGSRVQGYFLFKLRGKQTSAVVINPASAVATLS